VKQRSHKADLRGSTLQLFLCPIHCRLSVVCFLLGFFLVFYSILFCLISKKLSFCAALHCRGVHRCPFTWMRIVQEASMACSCFSDELFCSVLWLRWFLFWYLLSVGLHFPPSHPAVSVLPSLSFPLSESSRCKLNPSPTKSCRVYFSYFSMRWHAVASRSTLATASTSHAFSLGDLALPSSSLCSPRTLIGLHSSLLLSIPWGIILSVQANEKRIPVRYQLSVRGCCAIEQHCIQLLFDLNCLCIGTSSNQMP